MVLKAHGPYGSVFLAGILNQLNTNIVFYCPWVAPPRWRNIWCRSSTPKEKTRWAPRSWFLEWLHGLANSRESFITRPRYSHQNSFLNSWLVLVPFLLLTLRYLKTRALSTRAVPPSPVRLHRWALTPTSLGLDCLLNATFGPDEDGEGRCDKSKIWSSIYNSLPSHRKFGGYIYPIHPTLRLPTVYSTHWNRSNDADFLSFDAWSNSRTTPAVPSISLFNAIVYSLHLTTQPPSFFCFVFYNACVDGNCCT